MTRFIIDGPNCVLPQCSITKGFTRSPLFTAPGAEIGSGPIWAAFQSNPRRISPRLSARCLRRFEPGTSKLQPPSPSGSPGRIISKRKRLVSGSGFKLRQSRASQVVPPSWTRGSAQTLHSTGFAPVFFCPELRIRSWRRRECGRASRPGPLPAGEWRICARDGRKEPMRAVSAPPGYRSTCRPSPCRGRCGDR